MFINKIKIIIVFFNIFSGEKSAARNGNIRSKNLVLTVDFFNVFDNVFKVCCKCQNYVKIIVFFANLAVFKHLVA